jgi:uvrABC system protein A
MVNNIEVIGANENNLKNISVTIAHNRLYGICGVSGSGKSSLACDVIARYALNNFSLSMSTRLKNKLFNNNYPNVKKISGLPPVILIDIKNINKSERSTVATISGIMTILRNIFAESAIPVENLDVKVLPKLFSYNISQKDDGGACEHCGGTGRAESISETVIFNNESLGIFNGGFSVVNEKGLKYTKISDLFIKAFCKEYNIDINKKIKDFTKTELELLFYGSDKIISFNDRTGSNNGKKT